MSEGEEKTEQPSDFKLREARKKGQVAKSADVVALFGLFFTVAFLAFFSPFCLKKTMTFLVSLNRAGYGQTSSLLVQEAAREAFDLWFILSIPILLAAAVGALIGNLCQFGFLLSTHPIKPDLKKINPISGLKKIFSKDRLVELIKQIVKFSAVSIVIYLTVKDALFEMSLLFRLDLSSALGKVIDLISTIIVRVLLCFFAIAVFDFFWQRYSFTKSMRMSKYEVKKEYKQQEGDPHIKQERRRIQQETLESLSTSSVGDASVVITNPSHLAVAIKYDEENDQTPIVIAKGVGRLAKSIIEEARRKDVPIMRNVPLARDLQWLEINEEIPSRLYDSVAEVLTFISELNGEQLRNENH